MLVDGNLLLGAALERHPDHTRARPWLEERLSGARRVGIPWRSLSAFLRISTHPRALPRPLSPHAAWGQVEQWLDLDVVWTPQPGPRHAALLGGLIARYGVRGNLVPDAQLAALAIEHGLVLCSTDTDFARFEELRWENPLGGRS